MSEQLTPERIEELLRSERKLRALERGGVDDWEWYGESLKDFQAEEERKDAINEMVGELAAILLEGAHEPSERGAGYATSDKALKEARIYLFAKVNELIEEAQEIDKD